VPPFKLRSDLTIHCFQIATLESESPNYPYTLPGDAQVLARCPDKSTMAVGYSTGEIRAFDYISKKLLCTLRGHRSGVVCLAYDKDGKILASGGADSDIFVWDMVATVGICKLRGHKDVVTGVSFLQRGSQSLLVSVSKDTLLKVWDLDTQYCIQTIVGHRCEIWSLAVLHISGAHEGDSNSDSYDDANVRVITGSSDDVLRGYRIPISGRGRHEGSVTAPGGGGKDDENNEDEDLMRLDDDEAVLEYYGSVKRTSNDKCSSLALNSVGSLLAAVSSGKVVEVWSF
jgi:U3 small nucleolar RNA-associated protein 12